MRIISKLLYRQIKRVYFNLFSGGADKQQSTRHKNKKFHTQAHLQYRSQEPLVKINSSRSQVPGTSGVRVAHARRGQLNARYLRQILKR